MNCQDIQNKLLMNCDIHNEDELIKQHINSCSSCKSFYNLLTNFESAVNFSDDENLKPNTATNKYLLKIVKQNGESENGLFSQAIEKLKAVLNIKIPVYQAVLSGIGIILITIAVSSFSSRLNKHAMKSAAKQSNIADQFSMEQNIDTLQKQPIGRSVKEDSLLMKLLFSSM